MYTKSDSPKLRLFARSVQRLESSALNAKHEERNTPYLVYIPGGASAPLPLKSASGMAGS